MSETTTTAPEGAEATNNGSDSPAEDLDRDKLSTRELNNLGWDDQSAIEDPDGLDKASDRIVAIMPKLKDAEDKATSLMVELADAVIDVRQSCTYKGKPDTYGVGKAYRDAFERRIVERVAMATPGLSRDYIKDRLDKVRINYLSHTATRSKDMLSERIIRDAVKAGEIPNAKLDAATGKVIITPVRKDGTPVTVKVKDQKTGEMVEVPKVVTYEPGQKADVLPAIKAVVQKTMKERGRPNAKVPERFGGKVEERGSGGGKPTPERNYGEEYQGALKLLTEDLDRIATLTALQWFHGAATALWASLNRKDLTNPEEHAAICDKLAEGFKVEAAVLRAQTTPEKLDPFGFVPDPIEADAEAKAA